MPAGVLYNAIGHSASSDTTHIVPDTTQITDFKPIVKGSGSIAHQVADREQATGEPIGTASRPANHHTTKTIPSRTIKSVSTTWQHFDHINIPNPFFNDNAFLGGE